MKRTAILREAYRQYLAGERSLDSVLDLADHLRGFLRGGWDGEGQSVEAKGAPPAVGAARQTSALHKAYRRCLDGDLPLDEVLDMADRILRREPPLAKPLPVQEHE